MNRMSITADLLAEGYEPSEIALLPIFQEMAS